MKSSNFVASRILCQLPRPIPFICRRCLSRLSSGRFVSHRRLYSIEHEKPPPLPPHSGFACLSSRRIIALRGPDAAHYLQGAITANISTSRRTTGFYTAFLNAQGRVLNDVFIYPDSAASEDAWLIDVDAAEADALYKHIRRYKLRAKFDVRLVEASEMSVWSIWQANDGNGYSEHGATWTAHKMNDRNALGSKDIGCTDSRAPGMGRRLVLPDNRRPEAAEDMEESNIDVYKVRRYLKGVAEGQREILRETALPQESNIDFMGGIDYRKGCYVGQELTIRSHHTGVIRKRILPLMIYREDEEIPMSLKYLPAENLESPLAETGITRFKKMGRSAGKWLAGIGNIGLGLCRVEIMTPTVVQGEAGSYQDRDEFKLEWKDDQGGSKVVKVKAFVPSWHLKK